MTVVTGAAVLRVDEKRSWPELFGVRIDLAAAAVVAVVGLVDCVCLLGDTDGEGCLLPAVALGTVLVTAHVSLALLLLRESGSGNNAVVEML